MRCNQCGHGIDDQMNFCPLCGCQIGSVERINAASDAKIKVEYLYKNKKYDELLRCAIAGNNIAKYYYIEYMYEQANRSSFLEWDSILKFLIDEKRKETPFAIAAYGIFWYKQEIRGSMGVIDTDAVQRAIKLVQKAADMNESAAMTELGEWYSNGTEYIKSDEYRGYQLIQKAACMGYPRAMRILGYWHYNGTRNVSLNEDLGYELIEKAAFMGEYSARKIILEQNPDWFDDEFEFSISKENVSCIISSLQHLSREKDNNTEENVPIDNSKIDVISLIEKCSSVDEYKTVHKHLKDKSDIALKEKKIGLLFIEEILSSIMGVQINNHNIEDAEKTKIGKEKARDLLNRYTVLPHFLHFKNDLAHLGLTFDENDMNDLMKTGSELINEKCAKELKSYHEYLHVQSSMDMAKGCSVFVVIGIILSVLISLFFIIGGVIVGVISALALIGVFILRAEGKSRSPNEEECFKLLNALVGYGYKVGDIEHHYQSYQYTNSIKSILDDVTE